MQNLKKIVEPFYTHALTVNQETTPAEALANCLSESFVSESQTETKSRDVLAGQLAYFWQLIPNLKWDIQEMLQENNRVVVRSIASGNPVGDFFGLPCDGSKAFHIDTIDIHTIENGRVIHTWHVEEWAMAMQQLKK